MSAGTSYPAKTIAQLFNLTVRRVQQLANEGVITKTSRGQYDLIASVQGYIKFLQDIAEGKGYTDEKGTSRTQLDKARALKATIDAKKAEGTVLDKEDVQTVLNEAMVIIASQMDGIGGRLAGELAGMTDAAAIRQKLLNETRRIRSAAADRLSCLGAIGDGSKDTAAPTRKKRRPVGKRKAGAANRKRRTRPVEK